MSTNLRSLLQAALLLIILFVPAKWVQSQTTETFESFTVNSASYTSNSTAFTLLPTGAIVDQLTGYGYLSSNKYISNSVNNADPCQIKSVNATYTIKSLYLYPSSSAIGSTNSTSNVLVTFTGKLAGVTKFTYTPPAADFSSASYSNATNRGFSLVNFATPGYDNISIDELVVDLGGTLVYWAIDNFTYIGTPAVATIIKTATLTSFASCSSAVSVAQNFTLGGSNLTAGIVVTAPTGFEVSTSAGSGYSGSLTLPQIAGAVSTTTIYTRLTASASGTPSGNITCSSTGATTQNIAVTGTVASVTVNLAALTTVSCNGGSNGAATVGPPVGGTAPYTFNWTPGNPTGDGTPSISGLTAGAWTCTITDANGCAATRIATVTQPSAINFTASSQTNIACNGGATGAATVNAATGGAGGYTYNWTPGNPTGDGTTSVSGLIAGTWTCTVTDANGCTATTSFTITQPTVLSLAPALQTNIACNGGATGAAAVNAATGGAGGYTYNWTPGNPTGDGTTSVSGLTSGTWTCTVRDANGCTATTSFTITQPTVLSAAAASQTNIACNGGATGAAAVNAATGGAGGYTYNWTPGNPTGDGTVSVSGLIAGTWTCTVTDANGCTATRSFTITQPAAISVATGSQTNVSCFGGSNGVASVTPSGGTPGYTYSWSPSGGTAATATGLTSGTFVCTVTDANGCTATRSFTITQPTAISLATGSQTNVSCFGGSNGVASVTPSGGTTGYTYSWSPSGVTAATATGLSAGTYICTVTDANGCTATRSFTVTQTTAINVNASSQTNIACNGGATGAAAVNAATGGAGGYTYNWTPGNPTGDGTTSVSGLTAFTWTCTVTDANGCTATRSFTVTQPTALTAGTSQTNVSCSGSSTGNASVTPAGGTSPYTYAWSPAGGTAAIAANLVAGSYSCIITDSYGCSISKSFTITQTQSTPGSASYLLPGTNKTFTGPVLNQNFVTGTCELINTVTASGANPVTGSLTNKVWIESTVPTLGSVETPFVQRHYEITPAVNPTTATATVTLYFTQAEFDAFNAHPGSVLDLPKNPADIAGKSNLRIGKYSGSSSDQTGLPGSYTSSVVVLDPTDTDIVWNSNSSSWEISFAISGFSGFIVQTNQFVLPVSWSSFEAVKQGRSVLLSWSTGTELNTKSFLVQHSTNGIGFSSLSSVDAKGNTGNTNRYAFSHTAPVNGSNYYRIAQQDQDGKYNYSKAIRIDFYNAATSLVRLLNNPVSTGYLNLQLTKTTAVDLYSNDGKLVLHAKLNEGIQHIDVSRLAKGIYMIITEKENIKVLIQ